MTEPSVEPLLARFDILRAVPWLRESVYGNSLHAYLLTLGSFLILWQLLRFLRQHIARRLRRRVDGGRNGEMTVFLAKLAEGIRPHVPFFVALYLALHRLTLPVGLSRAANLIVMGVVTAQVVRSVGELARFLIMRSRALGRGDDLMAQNTGQNIVVLVQFALWSAGLLFVLDNAGFNVSTFLAGLGIGGVAIALATQAILGDAFNSFAISLDKPFEVGDFITVDTMQGTVEHIGLKSTRIRASSGELLIFANSDLTKARVRNFKRMEERRVTFTVRIALATPGAKLEHVPQLIREAVDAAPDVRFERCHLHTFGEWAYLFEASYFVLKPSYGAHAAALQVVHLASHAALAREGIALAIPGGGSISLS